MQYNIIEPKLNLLVGDIITLAIKVHCKLGPGLLESGSKECLYYEILRKGYNAQKEKALPLVYDEVKLDIGYRIDLLIENN
ncbi:MAG TPA: GxxExxY protein [Ferruginibacter sp.]|nr:GxxExxY protein [Ferruginibacter sp.]